MFSLLNKLPCLVYTHTKQFSNSLIQDPPGRSLQLPEILVMIYPPGEQNVCVVVQEPPSIPDAENCS